MNSDNGINPGSRLRFTLQGTPNARAFVRIRGVREPIALNEAAPGVYRGCYVIGSDDRIEPGDPDPRRVASGQPHRHGEL